MLIHLIVAIVFASLLRSSLARSERTASHRRENNRIGFFFDDTPLPIVVPFSLSTFLLSFLFPTRVPFFALNRTFRDASSPDRTDVCPLLTWNKKIYSPRRAATFPGGFDRIIKREGSVLRVPAVTLISKGTLAADIDACHFPKFFHRRVPWKTHFQPFVTSTECQIVFLLAKEKQFPPRYMKRCMKCSCT